MEKEIKTKYPKEAKICCSRCDGLGYILITQNQLRDVRPYLRGNTMAIRNKIRLLKKAGKIKDETSLRDVAKLLGMPKKSPQFIKHHILMTEKLGWDKYE